MEQRPQLFSHKGKNLLLLSKQPYFPIAGLYSPFSQPVDFFYLSWLWPYTSWMSYVMAAPAHFTSR